MYDHSTIDRANGVFARWDAGKAHLFMRAPGGYCFGWFPAGRAVPVLASFRRPTAEDGERTEEWGRCIPGLGFQTGVLRWESGLVHAVFRRVRWPAVEGRPDWEPPLPKRAATFFGSRLAAWLRDLRRRPVIRRGEPTF